MRRVVLERDGWRCRECGLPGRLEVDHVLALTGCADNSMNAPARDDDAAAREAAAITLAEYDRMAAAYRLGTA